MNGLQRHIRRANGRFAVRFAAATQDWNRVHGRKSLTDAEASVLASLSPGNRSSRRRAAREFDAYKVKP